MHVGNGVHAAGKVQAYDAPEVPEDLKGGGGPIDGAGPLDVAGDELVGGELPDASMEEDDPCAVKHEGEDRLVGAGAPGVAKLST